MYNKTCKIMAFSIDISNGIIKARMPCLFNIIVVILILFLSIEITSGNSSMCKEGLPCNKTTATSASPENRGENLDNKPVRVTPKPNDGRNSKGNNNSNKGKGKNPENYLLVPPFLIGASTVIVLYVIFHCIYMHCYTERRVKTITRKVQQRTPTIIIHDDANATGSSRPFTPVVKMEGGSGGGCYGKNEILQTQPFLVCQPLDMDEDTDDEGNEGFPLKSKQRRRNSSLRKSIQSLQVPNIFGKRRSFSGGTSVSLDNDASPGSSDKKSPNLERTRASICFVPVGKTISDPSNSSNAEWTPLQGFVYSSFILPRNPSYKNACGAATSDTSINSGEESSTDHFGGSFIVLPRKSSYCRSISQGSAASFGEGENEELLQINRQNGGVRHNSRVSFSFNVDQQLKEEEEEEDDNVEVELKSGKNNSNNSNENSGENKDGRK